MATAGLSSLEAVNEMLESVSEGAASALDSTGAFPTKSFGSSIVGQAESVLTRTSRRIQAMGWPENTDLFTTVTPALESGEYRVQLAATDLWIRASGSSGYRNLTMRGYSTTTYLYDMDRRSRDFLSTATVMIDKVIWLDFDLLQPRTKDLIVAAAATILQRRRRGSPDHDAFLKEEQMIADLVASRIDLRLSLPPINPTPQLAQVLAGGRQQQ